MILLWITAVALVLGLLYWLFLSSYSQWSGVFPYKGKSGRMEVALTFDDGPNEPYTSEIVDYLNSKNIKATFFQVGKNVARFPELTRQMVKDAHVIGNHSLSHLFSKYFTEHDFEREITESQAIFKEVLGKTPVLFRSPWLMHYPKLFKTVRKHNLQIVSGVFCSNLEVFQPSAQTIARHAIKKAKPGGIIIFHDGYDAKGASRKQTVAAVKLVVEALTKKGYSFVTVDKLLDIEEPYQTTAV